MSKQTTKATINANIKQNGNQEITGQILNSVLNTMVDDYGAQEEVASLDSKVTELEGELNGKLDKYTGETKVNAGVITNNTSNGQRSNVCIYPGQSVEFIIHRSDSVKNIPIRIFLFNSDKDTTGVSYVLSNITTDTYTFSNNTDTLYKSIGFQILAASAPSVDGELSIDVNYGGGVIDEIDDITNRVDELEGNVPEGYVASSVFKESAFLNDSGNVVENAAFGVLIIVKSVVVANIGYHFSTRFNGSSISPWVIFDNDGNKILRSTHTEEHSTTIPFDEEFVAPEGSAYILMQQMRNTEASLYCKGGKIGKGYAQHRSQETEIAPSNKLLDDELARIEDVLTCEFDITDKCGVVSGYKLGWSTGAPVSSSAFNLYNLRVTKGQVLKAKGNANWSVDYSMWESFDGTTASGLIMKGEEIKEQRPFDIEVTVPEDCYILFNNEKTVGDFVLKTNELYRATSIDNRFKTIESINRSIVFMGDSITWLGGDDCNGIPQGRQSTPADQHRGYTEYLVNELKPLSVKSYARSGARWCNSSNTAADISDYTESITEKNVIYNQMNRLINDINNNTISVPDILIVALGINDVLAKSNYSKFALTDTADKVFVEDANFDYLEKDIKTVTSLAASFRYFYDMVCVNLPNTQVIVLSPLQSANSGVDYETYKSIVALIKNLAQQASFALIEQGAECGVVRSREQRGAHYLMDDHLHPNNEGAKVIGRYLANRIKCFIR